MNKKIIIIVVILGIIALSAGAYFAWKKSGGTPQDILGINLGDSSPLTLPTSDGTSKKKIVALAQQPIFINWVSNSFASSTVQVNGITSDATDTSGRAFYVLADGKIATLNKGKEEIVSDVQLPGLQSGKISSEGQKIILKSITENVHWDMFNIAKNSWQSLVGKITAVDWAPDGKRIMYLESVGAGNTSTNNLIIKDLADAKQKTTKVISLNLQDVDLKWINNDNVLLIGKPSKDYLTEVWNLNLKTKSLSKIMAGKGLLFNWSKFGDFGIRFSVDNKGGYNLEAINGKGEMTGSFKFKTFPDKCFISSPSQIYCAIPKDQDIFSSNKNFPDDYLKHKVYFNDGVYQIDLTQNKFQPLYEGDELVIDAVNLTVFGNKILFINRYDDKLYSLEL